MNIHRVETVGMLCYGLDTFYCVQDYADFLGIDYPLDIPQKRLWEIIQKSEAYEGEIAFTNIKDTTTWFCKTIDEFFEGEDLLKPWMETEDLMDCIVPHVHNKTVLTVVRKHIANKLKALKPNIKPRDRTMSKEEQRKKLHEMVDRMMDAMIEFDRVYESTEEWESKNWKALDILAKDRTLAYQALEHEVQQTYKRC